MLVDSSVWISFFDRRPSNRAADLRQSMLQGVDVLATEVVLQEVLQGARSEAQFMQLRRQFATIPLIGPRNGDETYVEAARIYARCRWAGVTPRSAADCLIVRIAVEHGVPLFHDDRDFERIARFVPALCLV